MIALWAHCKAAIIFTVASSHECIKKCGSSCKSEDGDATSLSVTADATVGKPVSAQNSRHSGSRSKVNLVGVVLKLSRLTAWQFKW